jgi:glycosyltransferase involved in cell wall biosynthesis
MKVAIFTTDNREHERNYAHPAPYFGTAPEALLQGFALLPDVEVHVVSCVRQPVASPEKIAPNIFYHALLVPKIGWMTTGYQGCIRAARRLLKRIRPDIAHGQGTERECAICAVFSGFPNVLTIHGNMGLIARVNKARPFSYGWLNAHLERFTIPRAGGVVCITRYTQEAVRDLAKRTWIVPNAVDQAFFDVTRAPAETPTILCVGLVCHRKNQNAFIRALDPLATQKKFRVLFLGNANASDPYAAEFFELLKTRPWCKHAGFAGRERLRDELARATVLALPSLEDNCPMAVLEAMAAGLPVVAANVGGVPDLVEQHVSGLFCDPLDPANMRTVVAVALENTKRMNWMAETARQRALTRFHPRVIAHRHVEIYREVLAG